MTGREISKNIINSSFYLKAMDFNVQKHLEFETKEEAKNFLILYCVLLTTKEYDEYDEKKLSQSYKTISKILAENSKISSTEFLAAPAEKNEYILRKNTCLILGIK